jgi:hypothetical protein
LFSPDTLVSPTNKTESGVKHHNPNQSMGYILIVLPITVLDFIVVVDITKGKDSHYSRYASFRDETSEVCKK